jgi:sulfide:quinone oxidoreductase
MTNFRVVICGGGIAAVEGLLRLRRLAGDSVDIELVAPGDELVYRPTAVRQPFAWGPPRRYPLARIARDTHAEWTKEALEWVDTDAQVVHLSAGRQVGYDALLVAVGARQVEAYGHVATFRDADADATYQGIVQDVEGGYTRRLAFVQPIGPVWPLPLYELALMTAERAESMDIRGMELSLITPEPRPLAVFGTTVSDIVSDRLARAGVRLYTNSLAKVTGARKLLIQPQNVALEDQRIVAMPRVAGPAIRGLPGAGVHGFLPIDKHCAVQGTGGRVYAAGDVANYPIKHGGLGAQMADAAAAAIAVLAGVQESAPAFSPVIRGKLLTGAEPVYMSAHPVGAESFESEVYSEPPWPAEDKVVAEELGPYLSELDRASAEAALRP